MGGGSTPYIPKKAKAFVLHAQGDVEVLQLREVDVRLPNEDEVLLKVEWTGVNFIDLYNRSGFYPHKLPYALGCEPAGEVLAVGKNVTHVKVGDKAAAFVDEGGYAEYFTGPGIRTTKLPTGISTKDAASVLLQGVTALTNVLEAHPVAKGETVLVHAAAGGVGALLTQLASHIGATVIGTTSTEAKAEVARRAGASHVVLYGNKPMEKVAEEVVALTPGKEGVNAVFDGVGKDTFDSNFVVARRKATLVILGAASGRVAPYDIMRGQPKSLKVIRPGCPAYIATLPEYLYYTNKLFEFVLAGGLKIARWKEEGYPFTNEGVQQAHLDLAGRGTTGKLVIKVQ
ncbi:GroES-like protein [Meredithblackwellia eburnea MCA 4105]